MRSWSSVSPDAVTGLSRTLSPQVNGSTASFQAVGNDQKEGGGATPLYDRNWENEMETVLKVGRLTRISLVPRLNEDVGNVYGHQKPAGPATPRYFRAVIHLIPLATWVIVAQSEHSRTTRSSDGVQER